MNKVIVIFLISYSFLLGGKVICGERVSAYPYSLSGLGDSSDSVIYDRYAGDLDVNLLDGKKKKVNTKRSLLVRFILYFWCIRGIADDEYDDSYSGSGKVNNETSVSIGRANGRDSIPKVKHSQESEV
jgi:hypothetical protein